MDHKVLSYLKGHYKKTLSNSTLAFKTSALLIKWENVPL